MIGPGGPKARGCRILGNSPGHDPAERAVAVIIVEACIVVLVAHVQVDKAVAVIITPTHTEILAGVGGQLAFGYPGKARYLLFDFHNLVWLHFGEKLDYP